MSRPNEHLIATFRTIDHIHYHRGWLWYVGFATVISGIVKIILRFAPDPIIGYGTVFALAAVACVQLFLDRKSRVLEVKITDAGIHFGIRFIAWEEVTAHWFVPVDETGTVAWYLGLHDDFHHPAGYVRIELIDVHPDEIRDVVAPIKPEAEHRSEPWHETWRQIFCM